MTYFLIKQDGSPIGFGEGDALSWFANNVHAYSMDHAIRNEGYSVERVEELGCHDVTPILNSIAARHGITMMAEFVPFSKSRYAKTPTSNGKPWLSINWRIRLSAGRINLETDYSQGSGHTPASKRKVGSTSYDRRIRDAAVSEECETGRRVTFYASDKFQVTRHKLPAPEIGDVLHSLLLDSDVLNYGAFEDWANEFGYDGDSRSAETTYRACLEVALKLRSMLGEQLLGEMRLVSQFN